MRQVLVSQVHDQRVLFRCEDRTVNDRLVQPVACLLCLLLSELLIDPLQLFDFARSDDAPGLLLGGLNPLEQG